MVHSKMAAATGMGLVADWAVVVGLAAALLEKGLVVGFMEGSGSVEGSVAAWAMVMAVSTAMGLVAGWAELVGTAVAVVAKGLGVVVVDGSGLVGDSATSLQARKGQRAASRQLFQSSRRHSAARLQRCWP